MGGGHSDSDGIIFSSLILTVLCIVSPVGESLVPAGLLMATCRSALRSLAGNCDSPAKALAAVNRQLFPDMQEDMFISRGYMILEDESDRLRFARAGHEAPLMFRPATQRSGDSQAGRARDRDRRGRGIRAGDARL